MLNIIKTDNRLKQDSLQESRRPIIITVTDFDESDLADFRECVENAISNGQKLIPLIIDSYGGSVYQCKGMISIMRNAEAMGSAFVTFTDTKAMSCGQLMIGFGTLGYRFAAPTATIMLHEAAGWAGGKTTDVEAAFKELKKVNDEIFRQLARHCGHKDKNFFLDYIASKNNADVNISPKEAKRLGLIDHIAIPTLETVVSVETNLVIR